MTRRVFKKALPALLLAGGLLVLGAVLVTADVLGGDLEPTVVQRGGHARVPRWQVADGVVVLRGTAEIDGTVEHDVVVVDGSAVINGAVAGDVTVLSGSAVLGPSAVIGGDLRTSVPPKVHGGANVQGSIADVRPMTALRVVPGVVWAGLWSVAALTLGVALLVLRRRDRAGEPDPDDARGADLDGPRILAAHSL